MKYLYFSLLLLSLSACGEDDEALPSATTSPLSCCATAPLTGELDGSSFYLPTAFTPNGDGINAIFLVYAGNYIHEVVSLEIYDPSGRRMYRAERLVPNDVSRAWDGRYRNGVFEGYFTYRVKLFSVSGQLGTYVGAACSIRCIGTEGLIEAGNWEFCTFGTQQNGLGEPDLSVPSFEDERCIGG